jgi:rhamnose transport system substrate-binding protein
MIERTIKAFGLFALIVLMIGFVGGCSKGKISESSEGGSQTSGKKLFGFVSKTTADPMFIGTYDGFKIACDELGIDTIYRGTDDASAEKEIEIINQLMVQNVDGIAIIAADYDALQPLLQEAMNKGIPVVSVDSAANPASRKIHVDFANVVTLGRNIFKTAAEISGYKGKFGVLSGDPRVAVFADIERGIFDEYKEFKSTKYQNIELIDRIAYGYDLPDQSTTEGQALLKNYPDMNVVICPTTVAILAVGKLIQDQGLDIKITGIGLPSEMVSYFKNGICPEMWLWDIYDYGYLTGYTLYELMQGNLTGAAGEKFTAGKMGEYTVEKHEDGGTMVMMGDGLKFDNSNIDEWVDKL